LNIRANINENNKPKNALSLFFMKGFLYMTGYIINAIVLFIAAGILFRIPCCRNNRGSLVIGKLTVPKDVTVTIGNTVYTARGFYKSTGKTLSEKLLRNMEKELETDIISCYNIDKSQKGLDCKQERSIV
jgi:hypothetical protein